MNSAEKREQREDGMELRVAQADFRQADQLLSRAMRLLIEWNIQYGENQPSWLPPAGFVTLAEDYELFKIQTREISPHDLIPGGL